MKTAQYRRLRKTLEDEGAFRISDARGFMTAAAELAVFGAGLAYLVSRATPFGPAFWRLQVLLGTSLYRMFVILHECGHGTLFRSRRVNTLVGTLVSPFCLMPYFPWRSIHFLHHKWVGVIDKDPTQAHLLKLRALSSTRKLVFRVFWKCFLPVPYIKYILDVFWRHPFRQLRKGDRGDGWRGVFSVFACLAPHVVLLACLGPARYAVWFGPMLLVYFMIFEMVNLPQHGGLFPYLSTDHPTSIPPQEQDEITRSAHMPGFVGALFCYNFNLHTEHHLFPKVPWYRLPRVARKVVEYEDLVYQNVGMIDFTIESRLKDPIDFYVNSLPVSGASEPIRRESLPFQASLLETQA
jgi:fatty acid desaturase